VRIRVRLERRWFPCMVLGLALAAGSGVPAQAPAGRKPTRLAAKGVALPSAAAVLHGKSGTQVEGEAEFTQDAGKVTLSLKVRNASPGAHAVHLHEVGDCSDPEAKSAGPHWNPGATKHGKWGETCHMGDIGNVEVNEHGEGSLVLTTDLWTIGGDPKSDILGKSLIVHAQPDDFQTQPTGNAGGRIACGVVETKK